MAEKNAFPFTAFVTHLERSPSNRTYREIVVVSAATCSIMSENPFEKRRAETTLLRKEHPHIIPVIVRKADKSQMAYANRMLRIPAEFTLADFFTYTWGQIYRILISTKKCYPLISQVKHKDPIFEKLMSSVYEEYKDEDGYLYITLCGEVRDLNTKPIPSDISTYTDFDFVPVPTNLFRPF